MKLQNQKRHMIGMAVLCDGTTYQIDQFGVANVTDEAHAKKLLTMDDWRRAGPKDEAQKAPEKPSKPEPKAEAQGEPSEEPQEAGTAAQGDPPGFATQEEADDAGKAVDPAKVPPPAAAGEGEGEGEGDSSWPDPDMTMAKAYLQEMAEAYDVKFEDKTTKQELVDAILKKMYD